MTVPRLSVRVKQTSLVIIAVVVTAIIIWLDLTTGVWNDLVILAGLAAGFVSFLLTALVLDRILARSNERKWAPVSRLALTEFLHALADEERSEISRGVIVPRTFIELALDSAASVPLQALHEVRLRVVEERSKLADTLSRWAEFLASSGSNELVLRHVAEITMRLDSIRDITLEAERGAADAIAADARPGMREINSEIRGYNDALLALETELRARIDEETRLASDA